MLKVLDIMSEDIKGTKKYIRTLWALGLKIFYILYFFKLRVIGKRDKKNI